MDADDVWGDDDCVVGKAEQGLEREWQARRSEHFNSGYREGLDAGKHETVQEGFDAGYAQGAASGFEYGAARGAAAMLRALGPRVPGLAAQLQEAQQQQASRAEPRGQQAAEGLVASPSTHQQRLEDILFQQLQRQVCQPMMESEPPPCGGFCACTSSSRQAGEGPAAALPTEASQALHASRTMLQVLGLQAPVQHKC